VHQDGSTRPNSLVAADDEGRRRGLVGRLLRGGCAAVAGGRRRRRGAAVGRRISLRALLVARHVPMSLKCNSRRGRLLDTGCKDAVSIINFVLALARRRELASASPTRHRVFPAIAIPLNALSSHLVRVSAHTVMRLRFSHHHNPYRWTAAAPG
jgi:hypothetical protein